MHSDLLNHACALAVAVTFVVGLLAAGSVLRRVGVTERAGQWSLAYVVAMGALLVAVHLSGLAWLVTGRQLVGPPTIALIFPMVLFAFLRLMHRMAGPTTADTLAQRPAHRPRRLPGMWRLPVIVLAGTYGVFLVDAATRYPTGWDGVHYHLPMAVRWLQDQTLDIVPHDLVQNYPGNGMIVVYWLLCCNLQRLTSLVMLPQGILMALLVYAVAGQLGIGRLGRLIGTCVVMSIPIVIYQTFSSYVDLFGATAWMAALLALMWASRAEHRTQQRCLILVAGLAAGIAIGSKLTYIVVAGALVPVAAALPWLTRRLAARPWHSAFSSMLLFSLAAGVCSGFWFIRNVVLTGNPVHPYGVTIAGINVFDGAGIDDLFPERTIGDQLRKWWAYPWLERRNTGYNYGVGHGLGAAFATFVPLGLIGFLRFSGIGWHGRSSKGPRRSAGGMLSPEAGKRVSHQTCLPPTSAEVGMPPEFGCTGRWRVVALMLVCLGMVLFMTLFHQTLRLVLPMILLSCLCATVFVERAVAARPRWALGLLTTSLIVTGMVAVLPPGKEFLGRLRDGVWTREAFYEVPPMINDLPVGSTIVNVNAHTKNFALAGKELTNRIIGPTIWQTALGPDVPTAAFLDELDADYLFVAGSCQADWIDGLNVKTVYDSSLTEDRVGNKPVKLYRVLRGELQNLVGQPGELARKRSKGI